MNRDKIIQKIATLSYVDKNTLSQFIPITGNSLAMAIKRWLKSGHLIQLKRGLYTTASYIASLRNPTSYLEFIANTLKSPSYISMEYVLQQYGMISESVFGVTSVTLKTKRIYRNTLGTFLYRNIKEDLFRGYEIQSVDGFDIKIATKAKALFDYFYYKLYRIPKVDRDMIESFRLNYDELTRADLKEFSEYCRIAGAQKMKDLITIIKELA